VSSGRFGSNNLQNFGHCSLSGRLQALFSRTLGERMGAFTTAT
jgi:hypothetical protein